MRKGILLFVCLGVIATFLFIECETRADSYRPPDIGTDERVYPMEGYSISLTHIVMTMDGRTPTPAILRNQGILTYEKKQWHCQLKPGASNTPLFELPGHEVGLNLIMDGAENSLAYLTSLGYTPDYFISYSDQMYIHCVRSGREYILPLNKIESSTADLYRMFQTPMYMGDFLMGMRNFTGSGSDYNAHPYGLKI